MMEDADFDAPDDRHPTTVGFEDTGSTHIRPPIPTALSMQSFLNVAELTPWFANDEGRAIPPADLLDVVIALSGGHFLSNKRLGAAFLDEFGSVGAVLAADRGRLLVWLEQEGLPKWFNEQLYLRLRATSKLMEVVLWEKIRDRPIIAGWQHLLDYLKIVLGGNSIEQFRILFLDKRNTLIKDEVQQRGTVDHTPLYPREVARRSLELGASAVILVHNHPSGDPRPSRADIEITKQVGAALHPLRVLLHDHLIVGAARHMSFKSEGLI
jgi:DNA repair protein RadC